MNGKSVLDELEASISDDGGCPFEILPDGTVVKKPNGQNQIEDVILSDKELLSIKRRRLREACRYCQPLGGVDAQALEHALTITEQELMKTKQLLVERGIRAIEAGMQLAKECLTKEKKNEPKSKKYSCSSCIRDNHRKI